MIISTHGTYANRNNVREKTYGDIYNRPERKNHNINYSTHEVITRFDDDYDNEVWDEEEDTCHCGHCHCGDNDDVRVVLRFFASDYGYSLGDIDLLTPEASCIIPQIGSKINIEELLSYNTSKEVEESRRNNVSSYIESKINYYADINDVSKEDAEFAIFTSSYKVLGVEYNYGENLTLIDVTIDMSPSEIIA